MKIVHTSDLHIKKKNDDRWKALEKTIELSNNIEADVLVICGDLFNKDLNANNLRGDIRNVFNKADCDVIILPGNHDCQSYVKGLSYGDNVKIINEDDQVYIYNECVFWGLEYSEKISGAQIKVELNKIKNEIEDTANNYHDKINILLYHGELIDVSYGRKDFGDESDKRYMPTKLSYFQNMPFKYILAGHFHSNYIKRTMKNGSYFVYPGSPVSTTKKETGERYVNIIETGKEPYEKIIPCKYYKNVDIWIDPNFEGDLLDYIKSEIGELNVNAVIMLKIEGFFNSNYHGISETELDEKIKELIKNLENKGYLFTEDRPLRFLDISKILENKIYKKFLEKISKDDPLYNEMRDTIIKALTEVYT